jgi:hypothetical protein
MAVTPSNIITLDPPFPWDAPTTGDPANFFAQTQFPVTPNATGANPQSPANALQAAYNKIVSLGGGTIRMWRGTDRYVFDKPVLLTQRPVRIVQEEGCVIAQSDSATHVFEVGTRLIYEGLDASYDVASTTADRSLFKFATGYSQVAAVSAAASKFVRPSGSWLQDGYKTGDYILASGYQNVGTNTYWLVTAPVTDLDLPVRSVGGTLTNEVANGNVRRLYQFAGSRIRGGKVSIAPANANVPGYAVFRADGMDAFHLVHDLGIEGVTFEIRNVLLSGGLPVQQSASWTGVAYESTPRGIGFFRGRFLRAAMVRNCSYLPNGTHDFNVPPSHGLPLSTMHFGGIFIDYDSSHESIFHDLIVAGVSLASTTSHDALPLVLVRNTGGGEGGHAQMRGLECENVIAQHAVYLKGCPWFKMRDIHIGRWFPGKTLSAFRIIGGRANDLLGCGTHNVNGPENIGTFSINNGVATGTGIGLGISAGDYVELMAFSPEADGVWPVTAATANSITFDPDNKPMNVAGDGNERVRMQSWVAHYSQSRDARISTSDVLRRSAGPPLRFDECVGMMVDPLSPLDSTYSLK